MAKVIFVLHRRPELTAEQANEHWSSEGHLSRVGKLPGLVRFVQNHVLSAPGEPVCDGVGELYFESDEAMKRALGSPEMAAAVESAQGFLDMEKTGLVIVAEKTAIDRG
ncbi:MAG: EthD family reductase [Dehalococcoidia bacterium]|nr:EthD family reductase [Dehalococcoidia bacterium]